MEKPPNNHPEVFFSRDLTLGDLGAVQTVLLHSEVTTSGPISGAVAYTRGGSPTAPPVPKSLRSVWASS